MRCPPTRLLQRRFILFGTLPHAIRDPRIDEANVPQRHAKLEELTELVQAPLDLLGRNVG